MAPDFDQQEYWHNRFTTESNFEWLAPSQTFMSILEPYLARLKPSTARIVHLGFGTSDLQTHLRAAGFENILNTDYEPLAISRGLQLEQQAFGDVRMRYVVGDVTRLNLDGEKFDLVVDKSTADAVSCAGDEAVLRMARGVQESLQENGIWISMSYSARRFDLDGLPFEIDVIATIPIPKVRATDPDIYHYCYALRPKGN